MDGNSPGRIKFARQAKPHLPGAELFTFICVHLWLKILLFPLLPMATPGATGSLVLLWVIISEIWH